MKSSTDHKKKKPQPLHPRVNSPSGFSLGRSGLDSLARCRSPPPPNPPDAHHSRTQKPQISPSPRPTPPLKIGFLHLHQQICQSGNGGSHRVPVASSPVERVRCAATLFPADVCLPASKMEETPPTSHLCCELGDPE
jgi:hypothetical protein